MRCLLEKQTWRKTSRRVEGEAQREEEETSDVTVKEEIQKRGKEIRRQKEEKGGDGL